MFNLFLSIVGLLIGMSIGGILNLDIFIIIFGICGFLTPSVYTIYKIYIKINAQK